MANERPLLKYRNPDSTKDINDRLAGLLVKGVFGGGTVTPVSGALRVTLAEFSTVGSDGMFVKQGSSTDFDLVSDPLDVVVYYIVIQQQYVDNGEPIVIVEAMTAEVFNNTGAVGEQGALNPNMVVFATVTLPEGAVDVNSGNIAYFERDEIDVLGRSAFRGAVDEVSDLPIAGLNANRTGDYYTVITVGETNVPAFFSWNGTEWVNSTDTADLQQQLDDHRSNDTTETEIHISPSQANALSGAGVAPPSLLNRFLLEDTPLLPTADQRAALEGNGAPLEDELPNPTNPYVTSTKVLATPDEVEVTSFSVNPGDLASAVDWVELGVAQNSDGYYVGEEVLTIPAPANDTAAQWFNLYKDQFNTKHSYINDEFAAVVVVEVRVGNVGGDPTTQLNPGGDTHVDDLGFFIPDTDPGGTLYLRLSHNTSGPARASFGRRTHWGDFPPQFMIQRGPQSPQINTNILRLLTGTPNVQFSDDSIWDSVNIGQVAAWSTGSGKFVAADPDSMLLPIGVRGTANNLIQEGMLDLVGAGFPSGSKVYADKANPGSLTITENEWFIGTAITDTILLVNMNGIPLQASGEVTPGVTFPGALFLGVQEGQPCAFEKGTPLPGGNGHSGRFIVADTSDPLKLPTGIRGTGNNVIISGLYTRTTGDPYIKGDKLYADSNPGLLTTTENDWYVGIATGTNQILVNMSSVPVLLGNVEHDTSTGRHKFPVGGIGSRPANPTTGTIVLRIEGPNPEYNFIEYWNGASWETVAEENFASGTKMLFVQNLVPTGWTMDLTLNDKTVIITDTLAQGGTSSGSWVVSGLQGQGHKLEADELPVHRHQFRYRGSDDSSGAGTPGGADDDDAHFSPAGWGVLNNTGDDHVTETLEEEHEHGVLQDGTWRPFNVAVIVCEKD